VNESRDPIQWVETLEQHPPELIYSLWTWERLAYGPKMKESVVVLPSGFSPEVKM
jgi:hypothetical protein